MLQILIITMREGIEAFLIVAITAGILRQTGRAALLPALYWATGIAIGVSFIASLAGCSGTRSGCRETRPD